MTAFPPSFKPAAITTMEDVELFVLTFKHHSEQSLDYVDFVDSRGGESRISMQQAQVLAIRLCLLPSDSIPPNERFN